MTDEQLTDAATRLKNMVDTQFFGYVSDETPNAAYNAMARSVLDMADRDRPLWEAEEEFFLASAMRDEWTFMTATPEAWIEKARSIRARIEHARQKENPMAIADGSPELTEDQAEDITQWVSDWAAKYLPLAEFPEEWNLSERGVNVQLTRTPSDEHGTPKPIVVEGIYVGLTTHDVGVDPKHLAQRVDIMLHTGSSFPIHRDMTVEVNGEIVIEPPSDE